MALQNVTRWIDAIGPVGRIFIILILSGITYVIASFVFGFSYRNYCIPPDNRKVPIYVEFLCIPFVGLWNHSPQPIKHWVYRLGGINPRENSSFPGYVLIDTPKGLVPIEEIRAGDVVKSFDTETGRETTVRVVEIFSREDTNFIVINDGLSVTEKHPMALLQSGHITWKAARELLPDDCLVSREMDCVRIEKVTKTTEAAQRVYNMRVAGTENYFVLLNDVPVLVHNKTIVPRAPNIEDFAR
jgi:hypothetical protein